MYQYDRLDLQASEIEMISGEHVVVAREYLGGESPQNRVDDHVDNG